MAFWEASLKASWQPKQRTSDRSEILIHLRCESGQNSFLIFFTSPCRGAPIIPTGEATSHNLIGISVSTPDKREAELAGDFAQLSLAQSLFRGEALLPLASPNKVAHFPTSPSPSPPGGAVHNKEGCLRARGKFMRPVAGRRLRGPAAADDSPAPPVSGGPDWCMSENLLIYGHQLLGLMQSIILNYCGIFILFLSLYCLLMESLPPTTFRSYCRLVFFFFKQACSLRPVYAGRELMEEARKACFILK